MKGTEHRNAQGEEMVSRWSSQIDLTLCVMLMVGELDAVDVGLQSPMDQYS